jgi:hypothetical protein
LFFRFFRWSFSHRFSYLAPEVGDILEIIDQKK